MRKCRFTWSSVFPFRSTNENRSVAAQLFQGDRAGKSWCYGLVFRTMFRCNRHANDNGPSKRLRR